MSAHSIRVLHLRNSDRFGGPERLILAQARFASPAFKHEVASFVPHGRAEEDSGPFLRAAREAGVTAFALEQRSSYDRRVIPAFRRLVQGRAPDLVLSHDYKADLVARRALGRRRLPHFAMAHGFTRENAKVRLLEWLGRRSLRRSAGVIAVSEGVRDQLLAAGMDPARVHVVQNGIDVEEVGRAAEAGRAALRAEWGFDDEDTVLVFLGRLSPEKGADVLVRSFLALRRAHPRLRLLFVGEGAERERVEAQAREGGDAIRFAGWRRDAAACLGAADVFVLPSRREGLPLALLEAMAAGRPIVATRVGGVPEALEEGACGLLVPPDDALGLTAALETLLADEAARRARAARAQERVASAYSAAAQVRRIESLYADALGGSPA